MRTPDMPTQPTPAQLEAFSAHPDEGPVVMVNVLRFKKEGGQEAYARYAEAVMKIFEKIGARPLYMGSYDSTVIGDFDETFDQIALIEYPNRKAFLDMVSSAEYQAAHEHRDDGLESQWLLASTPLIRS